MTSIKIFTGVSSLLGFTVSAFKMKGYLDEKSRLHEELLRQIEVQKALIFDLKNSEAVAPIASLPSQSGVSAVDFTLFPQDLLTKSFTILIIGGAIYYLLDKYNLGHFLAGIGSYCYNKSVVPLNSALFGDTFMKTSIALNGVMPQEGGSDFIVTAAQNITTGVIALSYKLHVSEKESTPFSPEQVLNLNHINVELTKNLDSTQSQLECAIIKLNELQAQADRKQGIITLLEHEISVLLSDSTSETASCLSLSEGVSVLDIITSYPIL